jgi:hypothetical protein
MLHFTPLLHRETAFRLLGRLSTRQRPPPHYDQHQQPPQPLLQPQQSQPQPQHMPASH